MPPPAKKNLFTHFADVFNSFFNKLLNRYAVTNDDSLKDWQVTLFFLIFLSTSILGFFSCFTSVFLTLRMGTYHIAAFYFVVYMTFILITFGRFIPFRVRAWTGLVIFYFIGLINLVKFGTAASGRTWLFSFSIIACLTLGLRAAIITILIDALTLAVIGWMLHYGLIVWEYSPLVQLKHWITISTTFLFLSTIIILPLSIVVSTRDKRLLREIKLTESLRRVNRQYKQELIERKLVEKDLRESEEKFLKAFKISPAAMSIISMENRCFIDINDHFCQIFGHNREYFIGRPFDAFQIIVDPAEKDALCDVIVNNRTIRNQPVTVYKVDKSTCRCLFSAETIKLKGKPFVLAMIVDVPDHLEP